MNKLPVWTDVYPQGTKKGDEEMKFFIALSRHPHKVWRSIGEISKESSLTRERVEQIIEKYFNKGMLFQNPKDDDSWAYWENVPELLPKPMVSIGKKDQDERIKKCKKKDCC